MRHSFLFVVSLLLLATSHAAEPPPAGTLLRAGNWGDDIGTYEVPAAFAKLKPTRWPVDGWQRVTLHSERALAVVTAQAAPAGQRPKFLATIVSQLMAAQAGTSSAAAGPDASTASADNTLYLRFAGTPLREGEIPLYRFKNGTTTLAPKLDHRYELKLGELPFAFTVRNGLKGRDGASFGGGAQYSLEYDGKAFVYSLQEYGWDSKVTAIADFDGDGKPDFLITVGGNNSFYEHLLLSSLARPGKNPASAALRATGC